MTAAETREVVAALLGDDLSTEERAAVLTAWSERGETGEELAAVTRELLARAAPAPRVAPSLDVCGTGGSGKARFNVSTTVAFVLAAAGVPVAKHGNRGSTRPNGSVDLLEALGIPVDLGPKALETLHQETGLCFLFARAFHPCVAAIAGARKLARGRTIFNLAGPLANPCRPRRQMVGFVDTKVGMVIVEALGRLGSERAIVLRGEPGIDEISVTGATELWDVRPNATTRRVASWGGAGERPGTDLCDAGAREHAAAVPVTAGAQEPAGAMPVGDAEHNARAFADLLQGRITGTLLDMVCVNAGAALDCWFDRPVLATNDSVQHAREVIGSGRAWKTFVAHRDLAARLSAAR